MKILKILAALILGCHAYGATITWTGNTSTDFLTASNWNPMVTPTTLDTAVFDQTASNYTPTVTDSSLNAVQFLQFTDSTPYVIHINAFTNNSDLRTLNGGILEAVPHSAQININSASPFGAQFILSNSSAGTATFNTTNSGSTVQLNAGSTLANATINLDFGGVGITGASTAGSAFITGRGAVGLNDTSTLGSATVNFIDNSALQFNNNSSGGNATVILGGNSQMRLSAGVNNMVGSLSGGQFSSVLLNGANLEIGSNNTDETFAGTMSTVGGSLTKVGTGTQILSGNNTYTGPTTVAAGTLSLPGSVAGNFIVNVGATANGTGTVGGTYLQNNNSFLLVSAVPPLKVLDTVTILGGEVIVANVPLPFNTTFPILHSDISRTGVYNGVTSLNPNYQPFLTYDANNVYLTLRAQFDNIPGLTPNEKSIARAISSLNPGVLGGETLINALILNDPELLDAFNQLSGVQYANLIQLAELSNHNFVKRIYDPFRQLFFCPCNNPCGKWQTWASLDGGQSFLRRDYNAKGFKMYAVDVNVGAYRFVSNSFAWGIAGNYEYDHIHFYQGGHGQNQSGQGAFYGIWNSCRGYLFGAVGGGYNSWHISRAINFDSFNQTAKGKPHIGHVAAYVEAGFNINRECNYWLLQPFLGLEYGHYWRSKINESGADAANLTVFNQDVDSFETRLGGHILRSVGNLLVTADLDWRHRTTGIGDHINVAFSEFGPEVPILGPSQHRDYFETALCVEKVICPLTTLYVEGTGLFNNRFSSYSITLGLQKGW